MAKVIVKRRRRKKGEQPNLEIITPLKTYDEISDAYAFIFTNAKAGKLDRQMVDSMNSTVNGSAAILKYRLDAAKLWQRALEKKTWEHLARVASIPGISLAIAQQVIEPSKA